MASGVEKSFWLPVELVEMLNAKANSTEFVVAALQEKFERDELERFRASAQLTANLPGDERCVEFGLFAQADVLFGE